MHDGDDDAGDPPDQNAKLETFSDSLYKVFGDRACAVVERQIVAAEGLAEQAIWVAIWDRLCAPQPTSEDAGVAQR